MQALGGATPLMYACQQGREREVLNILMKNPQSVREKDRTLKTPLHYCAENENVNCAETILKMAPELANAQDENGYCPLHLAVIAGNKPFLQLLLSNGADVNLYDNEGHSAVHWAIVSSEKEALTTIIESGADPSTPDIHGGYPLHYAVQMCGTANEGGKTLAEAVDVVQTLLKNGVDVNVMDKDGRQPILWAASAGSTRAIVHLIDGGARVDAADKDGLTALHCAASRGHTETIEALVTSCGAEVDVIDGNGCSALFYAVTLGHADSTSALLNLGAHPDRQDRKGRTPAHCGAAKGQLETLRILKRHGGNLWLRNIRGDLPFHEAVASGRRELVLWLLEQNPEAVNIGNNDGRHPLHVAAMYNDPEMIKLLLEAKAMVNPIMRSSKGVLMTPLNVALCKGHRRCGKFLQLHGGVPFSKVSKSEANHFHVVRISPSRNVSRENGEWREEIVSPSFTIIKASHAHLGDETRQEDGEKKKVYRRRKKRKGRSSERKFDEGNSDSESDFPEGRFRSQSRISSRSNNKENEGDSSEVEYRDGEEMNRRRKRDGTTSVVLPDGNEETGKAEAIEITIEEPTRTKMDREKIQRTTSLGEHKNVSTLSPEDFPPTMESINRLDSGITETEIDGTKTPTESENAEKENGGSTTEEKKGSNVDEERPKSEKVEREEVDAEIDINSSHSPSFRVLEDNDPGNRVRISEKVEKKRASNVQKSEKSTKVVQKKKSVVRKYEKTTKTTVRNGSMTRMEEKSFGGSPDREKEKAEGGDDGTGNSGDEKRRATRNVKVDEENPETDAGAIGAVEKDDSEKAKEREEGKQHEEENDGGGADENGGTNAASAVDNEEKPSESVEAEPAGNEETNVEGKEEKFVARDESSEPSFKMSNFDVDKSFANREEVVIVEVHQPKSSADDRQDDDDDKIETNAKNSEETEKESPKEKDAEESEIVSGRSADENPPGTEGNASAPEENTREAEGDTSDVILIKTEDEISIADGEKETKQTKSSGDGDDDDAIDEEGKKVKAAAAATVAAAAAEVETLEKRDPRGEIDSEGKLTEGNGNDPDRFDSNSKSTESSFRESRRIGKTDSEGKMDDSVHESMDEEGKRDPEELGIRRRRRSDEPLDDGKNGGGETSPRGCKTDNVWMENEKLRGRGSRVSRLCRRNKDLRDVDEISVTRRIQGTIRKYHLERGIFHQLLELKRLQIRAGRANEQVLVKRLVDDYEKSCASLGTRHFAGAYKFKEFERFLYDQLKILNSGRVSIPEMRFRDGMDSMSVMLNKSRYRFPGEFPHSEPECGCLTQRCHHAIYAYTTLPCSAYVADLRRDKTHKRKKERFLPDINQFRGYGTVVEKSESRPTTLELIRGNKKQVLQLPRTSDKCKKYYVTLTIKSAQSYKEEEDLFEGEENDDLFKHHRHAKSV